jgi:CubicO group peptidase (beta-lactamase class C family)
VKNRHRVRAAAALLLGCWPAACDSPTGPDARYRVPEETSDGWHTASLADVGMDQAPMEELLDLLASTPGHRIHSVLVVRAGRLVFEEYWPGTDLEPATLEPVQRNFDRETLHYVASVSKSITATLAGIARDQGLIEDLEEPIFSWFPEHGDLENAANGQVTLRQLLAFCSGYDWNEFVYGFGDPRDSHFQMFHAADPVRYLLGRAMTGSPGAAFLYNSGDTNLVGEIVRRAASSGTLVDYAVDHLFGPLGIERFAWIRFGQGGQLAFASGGVSLRPRDMAKLGLLYLQGGAWEGRRVVSQAWVNESTDQAIPLVGQYRTLYGYGYNWWLGRSPYRSGTVEYYRAAGWGGQYIYVFRALDLVLVVTSGGYYEDVGIGINDLIERYVLAAIRN